MFLTVVTSSKSSALGAGLTYEADDKSIQPGSAVRVPLRKSIVEGIVLEVMEKKLQTEFDLRSVTSVLGDQPLLSEAQMKTVRWMSDYYCCSLRHALTVWLPPPPWSRLLPPDVIVYKKSPGPVPLLRGKKQKAVLEFLENRDWTSRDTIMHETGASSAIVKKLVESGVLQEQRQKPSSIRPSAHLTIVAEPSLTSDQKSAYDSIKSDPRPSLLFGITGSGKTEIYAALIADVVREGKQAILLVPEILLTEHIIHRFQKLLPPERIAVLYSRLKPGERREEWKRIHRGEVSLVIGSRSALFAPLRNLGLIILDEEHEWTYKNEQTPRYHARETAEALCRFAGAKLVLGSATPSLESWARAKNSNCSLLTTTYSLSSKINSLDPQPGMAAPLSECKYHLARLPSRYGNNELPHVTVIDLADVKFENHYPFSQQLFTAIGERLERGEQSVLFLNRRGAASALLCLGCRRRVTSPESLLPFTVHHGSDGKPYLMDHTTGIRAPVPSQCPHCKSTELLEVGAGTQRIESILQKKFPKARILRADTDTLQSPEQMRTLLKTMRDREADILLGTQTVVKGLDLPQVTLAAVLIADIGLSLPHFRAGERITQLLTQLTGRSGRSKPGEVIIQTFRPEAPEVVAAAKHETERWLDDELRIRTFAKYPPMTQMIRFLARGPAAQDRLKKLQRELLNKNLSAGGDAKISIAPTLFGGGREWQVLLRAQNCRSLLAELSLKDVIVDVDPVDTL